ncbi:MAG: hypothetical protein R2804_18605 [Cyclobacteriaceae bacterium]
MTLELEKFNLVKLDYDEMRATNGGSFLAGLVMGYLIVAGFLSIVDLFKK